MGASTRRLQSCVKCPERRSQAMCGGCEQWFCRQHFLEHHKDLSRQMDDLTVEHGQLQQNLIADHDDRRHPLFTRIDRWESDVIQRIKRVANEVRDQLRDLLRRSKRRVEASLRSIKDELQEERQMQNYTEIDLTRWMTQLRELRQQLDGSSTIELKNDQVPATSADIPLIKLSTTLGRGK